MLRRAAQSRGNPGPKPRHHEAMPPSHEPQTVYSPDQFNAILDAGRLPEVQEWLHANGIDPDDVARDTPITIETVDGQRVLRYTAFLVDETGHKYVDPDDPHQAAQEERTAPLVVEPPAWMTEQCETWRRVAGSVLDAAHDTDTTDGGQL